MVKKHICRKHGPLPTNPNDSGRPINDIDYTNCTVCNNNEITPDMNLTRIQMRKKQNSHLSRHHPVEHLLKAENISWERKLKMILKSYKNSS
jgi:hypothetical protein